MGVAKERQERFEVSRDWVLPRVKQLVPTGGRLDEVLRRLDETYFDTPGAGLRLFGVTLRRHVGGSQTGWELQVPGGTTQTEVRSGSRVKSPPPPLARAVQGLLAGQSLNPIAAIVTRRTAYRVLDAAGQQVLAITDDQMESGPPGEESTLRSWREVQLELGHAGKTKDLKRARKLLRAAGATASSKTKLDKALGPIPSSIGPSAVKSGTAGELIAAYVAAQCDVLASNDVRLRTGAPVVHETRVAARRLRSTLRVFGDFVDPVRAEELNNELVWYADLLGQVRDREILSSRVISLIANLPPEQVRGPVEAEVTKTLAKERDDATQRLNDAMRSARYRHLIQLLRGWKIAPPLTDSAGWKPTTAAKLVKRAQRRADKQLRTAGDDVERLHRARRTMKRVRYAAELAEPADHRMKAIFGHAKDLQARLGEHQDAVVAAEFLARISASDVTSGGSEFTYGILIADEWHRAADIRKSLRD